MDSYKNTSIFVDDLKFNGSKFERPKINLNIFNFINAVYLAE